MEVGLGGRLDATNVVDPDISVITTVDLDHQEWLGYTIEAIAREKAGVMRTDKPCVYGDANVPNSVIDQALRKKTPLFCSGSEYRWQSNNDTWRWQGADFAGQPVECKDLPVPDLVIDNAATVMQVLQLMKHEVASEALHAGLKKATVAGRFQKLYKHNNKGEQIQLILDVAHNPQAAQQLKERLLSEAV